ncbi:MAG: hypothetical protein ACFFD9_09840 [Candidatus Thorarchaeota archaeon]
MMFILELTRVQAEILAVALPVLLLSAFVLLYPSLKNRSGSKARRYLSYIIRPPSISSLNSETSGHAPEDQRKEFRRQLKVRLYLVYVGIAVFILSSMIAEFYHVLCDLSADVTQGSTGLSREWSSLVFLNPFDAGWLGSLPWYGSIPLPPANSAVLHDPWSWAFFTDTYTDNPVFFELRILQMLLATTIAGIVFLLPLGSRTVRESFVPSLFYFTTTMLIMTRAVFGCFAQAVSLGLGGSIQYGIMVVTASQFSDFNLLAVILIGIPLLLALFAGFLRLGRRLWQIHYPGDQRSRSWFTLYVSASYWLSLLLMVILA